MINAVLIIVVSSILWRVRGGWDIWRGKDVPASKIWFAIFLGILAFLAQGWSIEKFANVAIATFVSHQLCSWGLYIGRLLLGGEINPSKDHENPLIDELIYPLHITIKGRRFYLYEFPRWFGFVGTTLTGLMMSYLIGLALGSFYFGFIGAGMGVCYYLGSLLAILKNDGKGGWNWGEFIYGAYQGICLTVILF